MAQILPTIFLVVAALVGQAEDVAVRQDEDHGVVARRQIGHFVGSVPGVRDAPTTAIVFGSKSASSIRSPPGAQPGRFPCSFSAATSQQGVPAVPSLVVAIT